MARPSKQGRSMHVCEYYMLKRDKEVFRESYATKTILNTSRSEQLRLLKGTLLCLSPSGPPYSDGANKIHVRSLDDENLDFECHRMDTSPLQPAEKDILIAVTSRIERYEMYTYQTDALTFGLTCYLGDWVHVKVKIDGHLIDVAGSIRFKGELPNQKGVHFGVELEEYRGAGTTDGTFRNHMFFACQEDCGVFVPINRIRKRYRDYDIDKRYYTKTPDVLEVDSAVSPSDIHVHQRVRVFTDEGEKEGFVVYHGLPPGARTEYVGIEMDHPVKLSDRNDGTYKDRVIFNPHDPTRTILCPRASVLPCESLDQPGILEQFSPEPMETSIDIFDYTVGSSVYIDTEREGLKYGHVIWMGIPDRCTEKHVGIELERPCTMRSESNDGTFDGKRLFYPKHSERTVLVPANSVFTYHRTLSSETVKDSLSSVEANLADAMEDVSRSLDPIPPQRHHSGSPSTQDMGARLKYLAFTDTSDALSSTSSGISHSAPLTDKLAVYGKAVDPQEVRVKSSYTNPSATGSVSTHVKYGQTSNISATASRRTAPPKDTSSRIVALATENHENNSWTTNKFPKRHMVETRSRKNETGNRPSADSEKSDRKSAKVRGQRTKEQDHGRVVSKFSLLDDVLNAVAMRVHGKWKPLAEHLGIMNKEITQIVDHNTSTKDCALDMLYKWREQMSSSRDKLGPLVKACHKSELHVVANELEQGLDEQRLHAIAGQVHESVWNVLGHELGLEHEHITRLQMEDPLPNQRVYNMLLDWRLMQTFDSDKPLMLAKALGSIGMDELALEVCRGLTAELLEDLARNVKDFWKRLGKELNLTSRELLDLDKMDDIEAGRQVILKWKRRQGTEGDLLGALSAALKRCERESLANKVVKGMDDNLLEVIANMVEDEQDSITDALGIPKFGHNDSRHSSKPSTLRLLQWWRSNRARNEAEGQRKLYDVLLRYEFWDAADMVLPASLRPEDRPDRRRPRMPRMLPSKDLNDAAVQGNIAKMKCSPLELADRLGVPESVFATITKWHDVNKQKFFILRNWINRNEKVYNGYNLGWQLCKLLLDMGMEQLADFLVTGSSANRRWFQETNFETYQESLEEENVHRTSSQYPERRLGYDKDVIIVDTSPEAQKLDLGIESVVEVKIRGESHYGVIKIVNTVLNWLDDKIAGIELEDPIIGGTDGRFEGTQYFLCGPGKAVFVYLSQCRPDSRFPTGADTYRVFTRETSLDYGNQESPIIQGYVEPQRFHQGSVGENKGIQGDQNSCYLDVTLYSMFSFNLTFDPLLSRPMDVQDVNDFQEIQTILREKIVNPLRQHGFVRADRVRDLRLHLDRLGLLPGMTNEEKDPEELLHMLVRDVLKAQPLIKTRHGDTEEIDNQYLYQIFMDKNDSLQLPRVEQLLHQSFLDNELKLVEIPECLIVQMPRFGKDYKMYRRILPSLTIDITDLLESYPRQCTICGELATVECRDCRPDTEISEEFIKSYCRGCCDMTHRILPNHRTKKLTLDRNIQKGFELISKTTREPDQLPFQRQRMELYAVVCIQTSHYVAFVKTEAEPTHWVFFDSMADRDASSVPGFNIPKVTHLPNFEKWLKDPQKIIDQPDDKKLPEHLRRLLGDAYICFYRKIGVHQPGRTRPTEWASDATNY